MVRLSQQELAPIVHRWRHLLLHRVLLVLLLLKELLKQLGAVHLLLKQGCLSVLFLLHQKSLHLLDELFLCGFLRSLLLCHLLVDAYLLLQHHLKIVNLLDLGDPLLHGRHCLVLRLEALVLLRRQRYLPNGLLTEAEAAQVLQLDTPLLHIFNQTSQHLLFARGDVGKWVLLFRLPPLLVEHALELGQSERVRVAALDAHAHVLLTVEPGLDVFDDLIGLGRQWMREEVLQRISVRVVVLAVNDQVEVNDVEELLLEEIDLLQVNATDA